MKKWLIGCLTVLAMVCLIPGIALNAKAESLYCRYCDKFTDCEILGYEKFDSSFHTLHIKCKSCSKENDVIDSKYSKHTDDGKTPTCTTGKTCEKCGAEYGILGHDWGAWTPNYASNGTHTRRCKRCNAEETGSCSGGYATCDTLGMCNTCGGSYYGGHAWGEWSSAGNGTHTRSCTNYCREVDTAKCTGGKATCTTKAVCEVCDTEYGEKDPNNHDLVHFRAKAPTCTEIGWDAYEACSRCDHTTRKELPALNHNLEQHEAKAPTCTEKGWDAYDTCSRCDHTTYAELPALNHDLVHHDAKAPTCTEIGWNAYDTCSRCNYTTYAELPALNHDYQAVTVEPTCETDGYTVFTCSRCKDSYTADPTDKLGHQFGAWSPNGTGAQSADCLRQGCAHTGSTDCRKFTFRTAEGETLTFCPVCGQAENAAQLEKIEAATAWTISGSLSAEDVTARTNGEYLSVAFETAGSLTQPTGRVRLALPAGLLEGKKLVRIAPDGTQTEMPFETERGTIIFTLDFANSALPVMLFRLVPQTAAL